MNCHIDASSQSAERHEDYGRRLMNVAERIKLALTELHDAVEYAEQTSGDYWEFATEISRLTGVCRLTLNDLRWLIRMGFVEHQREATGDDEPVRTFRRSGELIFTDRSCFVLTDHGVLFWMQACDTRHRSEPAQQPSAPCGNTALSSPGVNPVAITTDLDLAQPTTVPSWDADRRVLSVAGTTVKRYKWVAGNQEAILSAFQEEGWPPRIDDPLPPQLEQNPKRRLSDTIKCLNRRQRHSLVHFRGDGTGEGVVWEMVRCSDAVRHAPR